MPEFSETGVWVDLKTNEVVTEEPEEGRQLVPKGGVLTDAVNQDIEAAKVAATGVPGPIGDVSTSTLHRTPPEEAPAKKAAKK